MGFSHNVIDEIPIPKLESLDKAVRQADREPDDFGFYPGNVGVMDTGFGINQITPSLPFGPWSW